MNLTVKTSVNGARIDELIRGLRRFNTTGVMRKVHLNDYAEQALDFLRSVFPRSSGSSNQEEFGMHLVEGWFTRVRHTPATLGFEIAHSLFNNRRGRTVLNVLETGHRPFTWVTKDNVRFVGVFDKIARVRGKGKGSGRKVGRKLGKVSRWVHLPEGTEIHRGARAGSHSESRTKVFIYDVLIPRMRADIERAYAKEL